MNRPSPGGAYSPLEDPPPLPYMLHKTGETVMNTEEDATRLRAELSRLRNLLSKAAEERDVALKAAHDWGYVEAKTGNISMECDDSFFAFLNSLRMKSLR